MIVRIAKHLYRVNGKWGIPTPTTTPLCGSQRGLETPIDRYDTCSFCAECSLDYNFQREIHISFAVSGVERYTFENISRAFVAMASRAHFKNDETSTNTYDCTQWISASSVELSTGTTVQIGNFIKDNE